MIYFYQGPGYAVDNAINRVIPEAFWVLLLPGSWTEVSWRCHSRVHRTGQVRNVDYKLIIAKIASLRGKYIP